MNIGDSICNSLEAIYKFEDKSIKGPRVTKVYLKEWKATVKIEDMGRRIINISTDEYVSAETMTKYLSIIERLLWVFDGFFVPLDSLVFDGMEGKEYEFAVLRNNAHLNRLSYFKSGREISLNDRLADWSEFFSESLIYKWNDVLNDLGVANQVFLYACCDSGLTIDIRCAFVIELAETLVDLLIEKKIVNRKRLRNNSLKSHILVLLEDYGNLFFDKEIAGEAGTSENYKDELASIFVNTRVNIMHIKRKQKTPYLNGHEADIYFRKFNLLYRAIILKLVGISETALIEQVKIRIARFDSVNGTVDCFIKNKIIK